MTKIFLKLSKKNHYGKLVGEAGKHGPTDENENVADTTNAPSQD